MTGITINISTGSHSVNKIDCGSSSPKVGGSVDLSQFIFLTEFNGGDNNLSSLNGISAIPTLSKIEIPGENTVGFNLSELSAPLAHLDIRGNNTISGNISNLPSTLKHFDLRGQNTTTGNLFNLPPGITHYGNIGLNTANRYYDGTVTGTGLRQWAPNMRQFLMFPAAPSITPRIPVGELVTLLIDLSLTSWDATEDPSNPSLPLIQASGASNPTINLTTYPSALAAILSLQAQGVTVLVNTTGGPPV